MIELITQKNSIFETSNKILFQSKLLKYETTSIPSFKHLVFFLSAKLQTGSHKYYEFPTGYRTSIRR